MPNYDASAFHAQQSAEKYLQARLQEASIRFPRTHDLGILVNLVIPIEPQFAVIRQGLNILTASAVWIRYPGRSANTQAAKEAIATARALRALVRAALSLPP